MNNKLYYLSLMEELFMIAYFINYFVIRINVKHEIEAKKWLPKVIIGAIGSTVIASIVYYILFYISRIFVSRSIAELIGLIFAALVCGIIYLFYLIFSKALSKEEASSIPKLSGLVSKIYKLVGDK